MDGLVDVLVALIAATALSATIGLASLLAGHAVELASVPRLWRTWWLGDLCGALIIVPLAIAWFSPSGLPAEPAARSRRCLLTIMLLGLIMLAWRSECQSLLHAGSAGLGSRSLRPAWSDAGDLWPRGSRSGRQATPGPVQLPHGPTTACSTCRSTWRSSAVVTLARPCSSRSTVD